MTIGQRFKLALLYLSTPFVIIVVVLYGLYAALYDLFDEWRARGKREG